jgi:hypothetical protein
VLGVLLALLVRPTLVAVGALFAAWLWCAPAWWRFLWRQSRWAASWFIVVLVVLGAGLLPIAPGLIGCSVGLATVAVVEAMRRVWVAHRRRRAARA